MSMRAFISAISWLVALSVQGAWAQTAPLEITGEVRQPLTLSRTELLALRRRDYAGQRTVAQDGKETQIAIRYQGVPLGAAPCALADAHRGAAARGALMLAPSHFIVPGRFYMSNWPFTII